MKKEDLKFILVISILISLIFIPCFVHGFNITTDERTETSLIWNLSALPNETNITSIALDGILLEGYIPNAKQLVQNNLYAGETHLIVVQTDDNITSTGSATTIAKPTTENEKLAGNINLYFLFLIAFICLIAGVFIRYISLASVIICIIGIVTAFNHSFIMGMIFFALLIAAIYLSLTSMGE
jgi:uncharacterized membrane protein YphA (DoxX/SURF4 family)